MFKFSADDSKDRVVAFKVLNEFINSLGGTSDDDLPTDDLPKKFEPIWKLIEQVQKQTAPQELMSQLNGLSAGRFFGNYVNHTGDEDAREYVYILNYFFAMTCQKDDMKCAFLKFIGEFNCVYGLMATPTLNWYDVLRIIFSYMNDNKDQFSVFKDNQFITDPYPDFMDYSIVDKTVCGNAKPKPKNKLEKYSKPKLEKGSVSVVRKISYLIFISVLLLVLLFNPVAFKVTHMVNSSNEPTKSGIVVHSVILFGLIVFAYFLL